EGGDRPLVPGAGPASGLWRAARQRAVSGGAWCCAGRCAAARAAALLSADASRLPKAERPARVGVAARNVSRAVDRPRGAPRHLGCGLHVRAEGRVRRGHLRTLRDKHQLRVSVPRPGPHSARRGNTATFARPPIVSVSRRTNAPYPVFYLTGRACALTPA